MDNTQDKQVRIAVKRASRPLFNRPSDADNESWSTFLLKGAAEDTPSNDDDNIGIVAHPFQWTSAKNFKNGDPHHSTCIEVKRESTVGLGFEDDKIDDKLDELCLVTWQDVITAAVEDYWIVGNGFIEVVRKGKKIVGIHHLQAERVNKFIEDKGEFHFRIFTKKGKEIRAAAFGDKEDFLARAGKQGHFRIPEEQGPDETSEVIHLRRPTSLHKDYGMPDWLAAVAQIELAHAITQYNYDFFLNSGVPEFIMIVSGAEVGKEEWASIETSFQSGTGIGNAHQTILLNIPNENVKLLVEKLGTDMAEGWFESMLETVASRIVSAHRVPPLIAGILIPGKLGANNEFINAMWMFQTLVIRPAQTCISKCLKRTLGSKNGVEGLKGNKFEMKTITEEVPVAQVEAPGSMDEPPKAAGTRKDAGTPATRRATIKKWEEEMSEKFKGADPAILGKALGGLLHAYLVADGAAA